MRHLLVPVFLLSFLLPALAEEEREKPDVEEKVEVIGRVPLVRALQSVTVLDRERIRDEGPDDLKGLLNQCPGMLVLNAGNPAQFAYAFARGASVNQTLYLINGVRLHDPSSSLAGNFAFLDPQLAEKLEVVRGPLSNRYGSSAMGGVVHLVTRKQEGLVFSLAGGSHGSWDSRIHYGKRLGDFHLFLNGGILHYDDDLANDRMARRGFTVDCGYDGQDWGLGLSLFGSLLDAGIPWNLGAATPRRRYGQDNLVVALPLNLQFNPRSRLDFTGALHWNRYDFIDPDDAWNPQLANESFLAEMQAKYTAQLRPAVKLTAGADLASQRIASSENHQALIPRVAAATASAYADLQADLGRLLLAASVRLDKHQGLAGVLSPQVGLSFNPTPFLKLRASASRSFRAPSPPELLNPYWGNTALVPETGRSLEAGFDLHLAAGQGGLTVFASDYRNLIGFSPLTSRFANLNRARISGLEASVDWRIAAGLRGRASYTYLHTQDVQYGRQLLRRPRHALGASLSYRAPSGLAAALATTFVGRRLDYDELLWTVAENSAFNQVGLTLSLPLPKRFSLFCRVDNALNARFEEVLGYPAPPRRLMLGIAFREGD